MIEFHCDECSVMNEFDYHSFDPIENNYWIGTIYFELRLNCKHCESLHIISGLSDDLDDDIHFLDFEVEIIEHGTKMNLVDTLK